ncbi:MAG TPA: FMN-dependent NADH-azoreductase [Fibrobacteria bacterium]|nr:FMN-dependent NADH-azoreductase [Fibrobacteria bacterium]
MKNVLVIESSPHRKGSYSRRLTEAILGKLKENNSGAEVKVRDLAERPLPHLDGFHLAAFFIPPQHRTENDRETLRSSEEAIAEVLEADAIIIGMPMFNFSIPSSLKAWIDHIVRAGRTFNFTAIGPEGLVKGKKVYLAISTGSVYSDGPLKARDFTEVYMRTILGFIGLTDITTFRVEGVAVSDLQATALERAISSVDRRL